MKLYNRNGAAGNYPPQNGKRMDETGGLSSSDLWRPVYHKSI
jgi:hypothetical protein